MKGRIQIDNCWGGVRKRNLKHVKDLLMLEPSDIALGRTHHSGSSSLKLLNGSRQGRLAYLT